MDEPQPIAPTDGGATAVAQPTEVVPAPAATPTEPASPTPAPSQDDTAAWFQAKGVDPSDPEALHKVAEMARNAEKLMTKAAQEASQLKQAMTPQAPVSTGEPLPGVDPRLGGFIEDYYRDKQINDFKGRNPGWEQHEQQMVELLNQPVQTNYGVFTREQLVNSGVLSLDDVYAIAKGSAPVDTTQIQQAAKQEVLQTLANTQRAGGGNTQASNSNPQAPVADPILEGIKRSRGE